MTIPYGQIALVWLGLGITVGVLLYAIGTYAIWKSELVERRGKGVAERYVLAPMVAGFVLLAVIIAFHDVKGGPESSNDR